jgi:hypothetical protein
MTHCYTLSCDCSRCVREKQRREKQSNSDPRRLSAAARNIRRGRARERIASPAEQHARYIDCGPQAWDDRGESPDY